MKNVYFQGTLVEVNIVVRGNFKHSASLISMFSILTITPNIQIYFSMKPFTPKAPKVDKKNHNLIIKKNGQISLSKPLKNKHHFPKIQPETFRLNDHTIGFRAQDDKVELLYIYR